MNERPRADSQLRPPPFPLPPKHRSHEPDDDEPAQTSGAVASRQAGAIQPAGAMRGCSAARGVEHSASMTASAPLADLAPAPGAPRPAPDAVLERFLAYVEGQGLSLYPAQEEAVLELVEDRHVILNTPTGSGKSLVATALHAKALAEGRTSYYTSPIKALVNEKFFALCDLFGPEKVGMLTGDASINREAPILCCTAEILANLALREGEDARVDAVVMDEFHYYADRDRGAAWQLPLLLLPKAQFLLMSATLGDMTGIADRLEARTGRKVSLISNATRPVPLEFEYRLTPLHETIADLCSAARAPIYLVNFTQRAAAEQAQNLMSVNLLSKEEKETLRQTLFDFRFDSPYGKELQRFLRHGVGVHHAGLLPKYRRLVEKLAQKNLLRVISGTDTLGVGVNIPLRTVLFTQLCKYDGEKTVVLPVRDFHQIGGRAGRKGFDERGWVVAQAPEHVIENIALEAKAKAGKKIVKRKPPEKGYVHFDEQTFKRLQERLPEPLESRFEVTHGMLLILLQRPDPQGGAHGGGYRRLLELIALSHESDWNKRRHRRHAALLLRSLRRAGIAEVVPHFDAHPPRRSGSMLRVNLDLQADFSLDQTLSLFLVHALSLLDATLPTYALDVLTLVESILENPRVVLQAQVHRAKGEKIGELKAQGMEYDQRMEELEKVEHPKPNADFIYLVFNDFAARHPWIGTENIRPKSIAREMFEHGATFDEYVRDYGLERSEGVLLRYLADCWRTLDRSVPEGFHDEAVLDIVAFLRVTLDAVDSSLLEEWEQMQHPEDLVARARHLPVPPRRKDPAADPRAFAARLRAELHQFVRLVGRKQFEEAAGVLFDPEHAWTAQALEEALAPLVADHGGLDLTPRARQAHFTRVTSTGPRTWDVTQQLLAQDGDEFWMVDAFVDLTAERADDAPLVSLRRIGT